MVAATRETILATARRMGRLLGLCLALLPGIAGVGRAQAPPEEGTSAHDGFASKPASISSPERSSSFSFPKSVCAAGFAKIPSLLPDAYFAGLPPSGTLPLAEQRGLPLAPRPTPCRLPGPL